MLKATQIIHFGQIWRWARCLVASVLAMSVLLASWSSVRSEIFDQYQVKAVFLYNLTKFISWPTEADSKQTAEFRIGILGRDVFDLYLRQVVADETIDGLPVRIKHYNSLTEIEEQPCKLLFVAEDQMHIWPQIREFARANRILTVGNVDGFCRRGGIVNLLTSARKIKIEINMSEAKTNGFDFSSKLLKLARVIDEGKEE